MENKTIFKKVKFLHGLEKCNLRTPQKFKDEQDYYKVLSSSLNKYKDLCISCGVPSAEKVSKCCELIIESICLYLKGNAFDAQQCIDQALLFLDLENSIITSNIGNCVGFAPIKSVAENKTAKRNILFRARKDTDEIISSTEKMLHIPFDKRSVASAGRFSLPGLPCLYLGSTSYVCWLELNKPSDNVFYVSTFDFLNDLKIFALTVEYEALYIWVNNYYNETQTNILENLICILPFTYASSFSYTGSENRNFHIEYIVPQMIMSFALRNGYDGVAYLSNKLKRHAYDAYGTGVNFAIWAKYEHNAKKYSPICKNITLSTPVNFAEFKNLPDENLSTLNGAMYSAIDYAGSRCKYEDTVFYKLDNYLKRLERESVDIET